MDIFKLGVRDIFGIVLPGAVLLFVIIYVFWSLPATLGLPALDVSLLKDQGFLLSIIFFVASYLLGYLLRLGTADQREKGYDAEPPCDPETTRATFSEGG